MELLVSCDLWLFYLLIPDAAMLLQQIHVNYRLLFGNNFFNTIVGALLFNQEKKIGLRWADSPATLCLR